MLNVFKVSCTCINLIALQISHQTSKALSRETPSSPHLISPPPVGPVVVQHPPPEHGHDLREVLVREGGQRQLLHLLAGGPPRLVGRGLAHLPFHFRVVHYNVCAGKPIQYNTNTSID